METTGPMKLIWLTDPHLAKPGEPLYGLDPEARLKACLDDIAANHADAELCVITGDLTHWGDEETYALLRDLLERLPMPVQLLLGNHDARETFRRVFPETPVDAQGFVQSVRETLAGRLVFLDTHEPGTHAGSYCERRRAWLEARLEEAPEAPFFLFMHHPPFKTGMPALDAIALMQRRRFEALLAPHRARLRHLFFGHLHRPVSGHWQGVPFTSIRGTAHQCWLDFEAPDQTPGSHEPPAYAVVLLDEANAIIHVHDFLDPGPTFTFGPRPDADAAQ